MSEHAAHASAPAAATFELLWQQDASAFALVRGRDFVDPDNVKSVALPALAHRIVLRSEVWVRGTPPESVVERVVASVPAPSWR